jgi:vacuolar-type H+-ATPase subunit E/Vma4
MGLDTVIENIQKEGKEKITHILQDAEKQADLILEAKQKTIDEASVKKNKSAY